MGRRDGYRSLRSGVTLKLSDSHRALTLRIASMFFRQGLNTNEIAQALSMPESEIWNRMSLAKEILRQQELDA